MSLSFVLRRFIRIGFFLFASADAVFSCINRSVSAESSHVRVGLSSTAAPYVLNLKRKTGIDIETLGLVFAKMGTSVDFYDMPLNRHHTVWEDTKLDAISAWYVPNHLTCHKSQPYRFWRDAFFVSLEPATTSPSRLSAFKNKRVGAFRGAVEVLPELKALGWDDKTLIEVNYLGRALYMLQYRRLDGFIGDFPSLQYLLNQHPNRGPRKVKAERFFEPTPHFLCFKDPALAKNFDKALSALEADPTDPMGGIPRKYGIEKRLLPPLDQ